MTTPKLRNRYRRPGIILGGFVVICVAIFSITKLINTISQQDKAAPAVRTAVVRITDGGFEPATLSVEQGTQITWQNTGKSLHQVVANPYPGGTSLPGLKSEILNNAQTYTYIAGKTGSFGYHDQMTPTLNGTLIVVKKQ